MAIVPPSCDTATKEVIKGVNVSKIAYKLDLEDALSNFLGYPVTGEPSYKPHKVLWDEMHKYIMESGGMTQYELDPWNAVQQWQSYFSRRFGVPINRFTMLSSSRRPQAMLSRFYKINKKREQILKRKDQSMKKWERALYPPSLLMMKADRFGNVSNLIDATQDITDKIRQSYIRHTTAIDKAKQEYLSNFKNLVSGKNPVVDINNVLDGIPGVYDDDGNEVRIIERKVNKNNVAMYRVRYDNKVDINDETKPLTVWKYGSQLAKEKGFLDSITKGKYPGLTDETYLNLLATKYMDRFVNDVLHGQVRYFIPKTRAEASQRDDAILIHQLERIKERQPAEEGGEPRMPGGVPEIQMSADGLNEYIMIKSDSSEIEQAGKEVWNVYLLRSRKDSQAKWENVLGTKDETVSDVMPEGFYKASGERTYKYKQGLSSFKQVNGKWVAQNPGRKTNIQEFMHKDYQTFRIMTNQPDKTAVDGIITEPHPTIKFDNLWGLVSMYRGVFEDVGDELESFAGKNTSRTTNLLKKIRAEMAKKINPATNKQYTQGQIEAWVEENIFNIGGISTSFWYDPKRGFATSDTYFQKKTHMYAPVMWSIRKLEEMMDNAHGELTERIENPLLSEAAKNRNTLLRDGIESIRQLTANRGNGEWTQEIRHAASTVHMQHRENWTSNLMRRKDGEVPMEYLEKTFRNLHRNELSNQMIESMYESIKYEKHMPSDIIEYMQNRVKLAFGHTDTINRVPWFNGWREVSNTSVANWMNKWIPKNLKAGRHFDEDSAEKMFLTMNGLFSMRFLGTTGAMGNRTQIINPIIHYGWDKYRWVRNISEASETEQAYWMGVVESTGVLNLLSMFNDVMLQGGTVDEWDFGLYPLSDSLMKNVAGAAVPIPSENMVQWIRLMKKGKDNFVKNGKPSLDKMLLKLIHRESSLTKREDIAYLRDLEKLLADLDSYEKWEESYDFNNLDDQLKQDLREKRDAYWGVFSAEEKENTKEIMENRMRRLLGDIADHKFKKMVTWKLSWHFLPGKDMFTFTEGEQKMRYETALMALRHADLLGLLGSNKNEDRFFTPAAIKIARDAVYMQMFGMSPVWLGEAFSGAGRTVMQYKAYPLFQMIHDSNVASSFRDGSNGLMDTTSRLFNALSEESTDEEAKAIVRMIGTRGAASVFGVLLSIVPFMFKIVGRASGVNKVIRSAENPAAALALRMIAWTVLMGLGFSDDDEEKMREDWANKLLFMLAPVFVGSLLRDAYDFGTRIEEL